MPLHDDARRFEQAHDLLSAADLYQEAGDYERARALYLAFERQNPTHAEVKFKLGALLVEVQEWEAAIRTLQDVKAAGLFPEETLYLLAECFRQTGMIYAARHVYQELLGRNPRYKDAAQRLRALDTPVISTLPTLKFSGATTFPAVPHLSAAATSGPSDAAIRIEDRYVLLEELGRGGMGVVYKALEKPSDRSVAIKVLPPYLAEEEMNRIRFFREAEIVSKLHHPHIVPIFETNRSGNFIVMEYIAGGTLTDWVVEHSIAPLQILTYITQILEALHVVHEHGIIHRDLKPDNILVADQDTVKLTDFGIAHICGATITHTGMHLGTLPYMSPEQILGHDIDRRSDIYAVGVLLYRLLTGKLPFSGSDASYHHVHTSPWPPRQLVPSLSPQLEAIMLKCLAKHPDDRFQNAKLLQKSLMTHGSASLA